VDGAFSEFFFSHMFSEQLRSELLFYFPTRYGDSRTEWGCVNTYVCTGSKMNGRNNGNASLLTCSRNERTVYYFVSPPPSYQVRQEKAM